MKKYEYNDKGFLLLLSFLMLILLTTVPTLTCAAEFRWSDYRIPFYQKIPVCHNESATVEVDLPEDFIKGNKETATLVLEVVSHTANEDGRILSFEIFSPFLKVNNYFWGNYRIPVKVYPARQSPEVEIKTKYLKVGQNTLKASFSWKSNRWECSGSCCGYQILQMYFKNAPS